MILNSCDHVENNSVQGGQKTKMHFTIIGSFGNEPMQSCSVRRVSLLLSSLSVLSVSVSSASASVYSPPSDSFDHRNFISCKYMQL